MARGTSFGAIRKAVLALPGVEEGTAWGFPVFRESGRMIVCFRRDLDSAVFRSTFEQRDAMIAEDPEIYHTTDHHRPYPWVLARVSKLSASAISDLLQMALKTEASAKPRKKRH